MIKMTTAKSLMAAGRRATHLRHQTKDPMTNQPRFKSNVKPMLLGCGLEDHVAFNDICPATMNTAPLMTQTPGKAIFMDKTGHSLDNERRSFWAREVFKFLGL